MLNDIYIFKKIFLGSSFCFYLLKKKKTFWLYHMPCGILVSQPGTEPMLPALEVQILNPWTSRGVPADGFLSGSTEKPLKNVKL